MTHRVSLSAGATMRNLAGWIGFSWLGTGGEAPVTIQAVVFDIGETLLDDSREFGAWADWIGVPRHTFSAVLGAVTAEGRDNAETFQYFRPGFDLPAERQRREDVGVGEQYCEDDLYPDVRPALAQLRQMKLWVGIAGNQTARAGQVLRSLDLPADLVVTSAEWGISKPDPAFFARVIETAPGRADEIVYVGDHRDNDLEPAKAAGLRTAHIRRGPWGYLWADDPKVLKLADWRIDSLSDLPLLLEAARADFGART
jgi:HAD superfamily hydrolase (TIGR01549 family)